MKWWGVWWLPVVAVGVVWMWGHFRQVEGFVGYGGWMAELLVSHGAVEVVVLGASGRAWRSEWVVSRYPDREGFVGFGDGRPDGVGDGAPTVGESVCGFVPYPWVEAIRERGVSITTVYLPWWTVALAVCLPGVWVGWRGGRRSEAPAETE